MIFMVLGWPAESRKSADDGRAKVFLVSRGDAGTPRRAELLLGKRTEEGNKNFKMEVRGDARSATPLVNSLMSNIPNKAIPVVL